MPYTKKLPATHHLLKLTRNIGFPATAGYAAKLSQDLGLPRELTDFLRSFPRDEIFQSRVDFMTRCEELEILFQQEIDGPPDKLTGPQDEKI